VNKEIVCELVRAHYDGDEPRFAALAAQLMRGESLAGSTPVAVRLRELLDSGHPSWRDEEADALIARSQARERP
jgi:hypothetical protein